MRYYYYRVLKQSQGFSKRGEMDSKEPYYGSLKKVHAKSKIHARKLLERKYQTVPFKFESRIKVWMKNLRRNRGKR